MGRIVLVTGGTRSGKSELAESIAAKYDSVFYVATAMVSEDKEMLNRIALHRERRPMNWETVEESRNLSDALTDISQKAANNSNSCALIDSIGTLVGNVLFADGTDWEIASNEKRRAFQASIHDEIKKCIHIIKSTPDLDAVFVSEEVGLSMVSQYAMGRMFTDMLGRLNQMIAESSDEALFVVSGIPLKLK